MRVEAMERLDQDTIICRVAWDSPDTKEMFRIFVRVHATPDEFTAPVRAGDNFVLEDTPAKLSEHIQRKAVQAAKELAIRFVQT